MGGASLLLGRRLTTTPSHATLSSRRSSAPFNPAGVDLPSAPAFFLLYSICREVVPMSFYSRCFAHDKPSTDVAEGQIRREDRDLLKGWRGDMLPLSFYAHPLDQTHNLM